MRARALTAVARPVTAARGCGTRSSARSTGVAVEVLPGPQYHRLAARRGAKLDFVAVDRTIPGIIFVLLASVEPFHDLGVTYFDRRDAEHVKGRL
jgi:hypothetical protein